MSWRGAHGAIITSCGPFLVGPFDAQIKLADFGVAIALNAATAVRKPGKSRKVGAVWVNYQIYFIEFNITL